MKHVGRSWKDEEHDIVERHWGLTKLCKYWRLLETEGEISRAGISKKSLPNLARKEHCLQALQVKVHWTSCRFQDCLKGARHIFIAPSLSYDFC